MNANRSPRETRALRAHVRTSTALRENAAEAFTRKYDEAKRRLRLIEGALNRMPANGVDWGHVGSLDEVLVLLQRAGHYAGVPELTEE
jgi:hypothetical protein